MPPYPDQLLGEDSSFCCSLLCLRRVPLRAFVGLKNIVASFGVECFEAGEFAIKLAVILPYEGVAFSVLPCVRC